MIMLITSSNINSTDGEGKSSLQDVNNNEASALNSSTSRSNEQDRNDVAHLFLKLGTVQRALVVSPSLSSSNATVSAGVGGAAAASGVEGTNRDDGNDRPAPAPRHAAAKKSKKRDREDEESCRAELKCQREKKRRRDMNKGFSGLMSTLVKIDPNIVADADLQDSAGSSSSSAPNRVEVISRTTVVLDRIHRENEDRKVQIAELSAKLEVATNERNQARALVLASNNKGSAFVSPGLQVYQQQGPAAALLQSLIQPAMPAAVPSVPVQQQLPLALSALLLGAQQGAQNINTIQPQAALPSAAAAGNIVAALSNPLVQKALASLSSRHYSL